MKKKLLSALLVSSVLVTAIPQSSHAAITMQDVRDFFSAIGRFFTSCWTAAPAVRQGIEDALNVVATVDPRAAGAATAVSNFNDRMDVIHQAGDKIAPVIRPAIDAIDAAMAEAAKK